MLLLPYQGSFDLARETLQRALATLTVHERELRSVGLNRLAIVERLAGSMHDALGLLDEAAPLLSQIQRLAKRPLSLRVCKYPKGHRYRGG